MPSRYVFFGSTLTRTNAPIMFVLLLVSSYPLPPRPLCPTLRSFIVSSHVIALLIFAGMHHGREACLFPQFHF